MLFNFVGGSVHDGTFGRAAPLPGRINSTVCQNGELWR